MTEFLNTGSWWALGMALLGSVLNIKKLRACFIFWGVSCSFWVLFDLAIGATAQALLNLAFVGINLWGFMQWKEKELV